MAQVVFSCSRADRTCVSALVRHLRDRGINAGLDDSGEEAAGWDRASLDAAHVMVLVLSPDAMESGRVCDEFVCFQRQKKPVLAVVLRETPVDYRLHGLTYIDFVGQPRNVACHQLVQALIALGASGAVPASDFSSRGTPGDALPRLHMKPSVKNYIGWALGWFTKDRSPRVLALWAVILLCVLVWGVSRWIDPDQGEPATDFLPSCFTGITSPKYGATVEIPALAQGRYAPEDLGEDELWLFVRAGNGRYYPQVKRTCQPSALMRFVCRQLRFLETTSACQPASGIVITPGRYRWEMAISLVPETSSGTDFELLLGTLAPSPSRQVFAVTQQVWCNSGATGFDASELYGAFRFNELDRVSLTRK